MKPFTALESRVIALLADNIDTDQIIPARFLKTISKEGLGAQLFYDWRYDAEGCPRPDFVLNRPAARDAEILVAGDNFGCGSSREHAPWALTQFGFRAVVSTSFADIFRQNALKNSLLSIVVAPEFHRELLRRAASDPDLKVRVDLAKQELKLLPDGPAVEFPIDAFSKQCLLGGTDELGYILAQDAAIAAYEAHRELTVNTLGN